MGKLLTAIAALLLCFAVPSKGGVMSWIAAAEAADASTKAQQNIEQNNQLAARVSALEAEQKKTNQLLQEVLKKLNEKKP